MTKAARTKFARAGSTAGAVYAKGAAIAAGLGALTRGNVTALIDSGKIIGAGARTIGGALVSDGKLAVNTVKADALKGRSVSSPTELLQLQGDIAARNLGALTTFGFRNAGALVKLAEASARPIAGRVETAMSSLRKAA